MQLPQAKDFIVPVKISKAEFEKIRPQFTEIAQLGFGLDYKSRWNIWMAIREFVQNAFDITTEMHPRDPRKYLTQDVALDYNAKQEIGYISDQGSGIKLRNIFLSERKAKDDWGRKCLRGQFGEGMKYALIPLLREGHQVLIRTVGSDYFFTSVEMGQKGERFDLIHMLQRPNKVTKGTVVAIKGLDPNIFKNNFVPFLDQEILLTQPGSLCQVLQVLDAPGRIFVRDIFITDEPAYFGYNFWFNNPAKVLDPDRLSLVDKHSKQGKFEPNVNPITLEMEKLFETLNTHKGALYWVKMLNNFYQKKMPNNCKKLTNIFEWKYLDNSAYPLLDEHQEVLFNLIVEITGTEKIAWAENYQQAKCIEHLGYLDLTDKLPNLRAVLPNYVKSAAEVCALTELTDKVVIITHDDFKSRPAISDAILAITKKLHAIAVDYLEDYTYEGGQPPQAYINFYVGDFQGDGQHILGFHKNGNIYLHANLLLNCDDLIETFIHELAHAACLGCKDLTDQFEAELAKIGSFIGFRGYNLNRIARLVRDLRANKKIIVPTLLQLRNSPSNLDAHLEKIFQQQKTLGAPKQKVVDRKQRFLRRKQREAAAKERNQKSLVDLINKDFKKGKNIIKILARRTGQSYPGTRPNPVIRRYRRHRIALKNLPYLPNQLLSTFYNKLYNLLFSFNIGTRGFTVIEAKQLRSKLDEYNIKTKPNLIGGLLLTGRSYDNLSAILGYSKEMGVGLQKFKNKWFKNDPDAEEKMQWVLDILNAEISDFRDELYLDLQQPLPIVFKPNDLHHFKAREYRVLPIYLRLNP